MILPINASLTLDFYQALSFSDDIDMTQFSEHNPEHWQSYFSFLDFQSISSKNVATVVNNFQLALSLGFDSFIKTWFDQQSRSASCILRSLVYKERVQFFEPVIAPCGRALSWLYALTYGDCTDSRAVLSQRHSWDKDDVVFWQQHIQLSPQMLFIAGNTFFDSDSLTDLYLEAIRVDPKLYLLVASKSLIPEPFLISKWANFFPELHSQFPLLDFHNLQDRLKISQVLQWQAKNLENLNSNIEVDFDF